MFIRFSFYRVHNLCRIFKDSRKFGTGSKDSYEIEKLKKIKEDSDREAVSTLQQLKTLSESRDSMHRELVELREVKDAALEVAEAMDIPERDGDEPLTLAGRLRKVPGAFERFVSTITPPVRRSRTWAGEILLANHSSGCSWTRSQS